MAVIIRTTKTGSSASGATSFTIDKPTGLSVGDKMWAIITWKTTGSINTPSGWTAPHTEQTIVSSKSIIFTKVADAADVSASNFTFSCSGTTALGVGILAAFGNVGLRDVSSVGTDTSGDINNSVITITGVTPNNQDFFLLLISSQGDNVINGLSHSGYAITTDNPSWTELADIGSAHDSGIRVGCGAAYASRSQLTATGNATATASNTGGTIYTALYIVGLTESLIVSADTPNATGAVLAPTISGGATVAVGAAINATGEVLTPSHAEQADWSAQAKSATGTWTNTQKS